MRRSCVPANASAPASSTKRSFSRRPCTISLNRSRRRTSVVTVWTASRGPHADSSQRRYGCVSLMQARLREDNRQELRRADGCGRLPRRRRARLFKDDPARAFKPARGKPFAKCQRQSVKVSAVSTRADSSKRRVHAAHRALKEPAYFARASQEDFASAATREPLLRDGSCSARNERENGARLLPHHAIEIPSSRNPAKDRLRSPA